MTLARALLVWLLAAAALAACAGPGSQATPAPATLGVIEATLTRPPATAAATATDAATQAAPTRTQAPTETPATAASRASQAAAPLATPTLAAATLEPLPVTPGVGGIGGQGVYLDLAEVVVTGDPPQPALFLSGNKPTPCHALQVTVGQPDAQNRIDVQVSTTVDPLAMCIQVLDPFDETVPLGPYPPGAYSVWVNGEHAGDFTQP